MALDPQIVRRDKASKHLRQPGEIYQGIVTSVRDDGNVYVKIPSLSITSGPVMPLNSSPSNRLSVGDVVACSFNNSYNSSLVVFGSATQASDDYSISRYANTAERDLLITSPQEGRIIYILETDELQIYNGTEWITVIDTGNSENITAATLVATSASIGTLTVTGASTLTVLGATNLTASTTIGDISSTELSYLNGVTSAIQTQINTKSPSASPTFTGTATVRAASTQDGIILQGRAGGTNTYAVTITPGTLTGNKTLTLPDITGTLVTTGDTGTVSNAMLATISTVGKVSNAATTATSANTANAIVARDASGNFSAGTITMGSFSVTGGASSYGSNDTSYITFGPNLTWAGYLRVGATPNVSGAKVAQVISTDGNLHLDAGSSQNMYLNYYSSGRPIFVYGTIQLERDSIGIYQASTTNWTGNPPNSYGKIEYHSNRWYIASGPNSSEILRIRRGGTDEVVISNDGTVYAYSYRGNENVAGTGEASFHPAGIYSTGTNWLYGTMYLNGYGINGVGSLTLGSHTMTSDPYRFIVNPNNYSGLQIGIGEYYAQAGVYASGSDLSLIGSGAVRFKTGGSNSQWGVISPSGFDIWSGIIVSSTNFDGTWRNEGNGYYKMAQNPWSTRKVKTDIQEVGESLNPNKLLDIPIVQFKYIDGYLAEGDPIYNTDICGLLAEEVFEHYPTVVRLDPETWEPQSINYQLMIPPLLGLIQNMHKRITTLESR